MSLNLCKSRSITLVQNVCFTTRNPGLFSGGFHDRVASISVSCSSFFARSKNRFFSFSGRQDGSTVSSMLLLCLHRWQCSTPGVNVFPFPVDLTVVQKGFVSFTLRGIGENDNRASQTACWPSNMGTKKNIRECIWTSRELFSVFLFLSSFKAFVRYPGPTALTGVGRRKINLPHYWRSIFMSGSFSGSRSGSERSLFSMARLFNLEKY